MHKIIAATILGLGLAAPAFAYDTREVQFDPAVELGRNTGAAQYPESNGGIVLEGRASRGGSEAYPEPVHGIAHGGTDMLVGGSSRYPVLTPDTLRHPPSALDQNHVLVDDFDKGVPAPDGEAASAPDDLDG